MTNKFTEEQYQKIVEIGENYRESRKYMVSSILAYIWKENPSVCGNTYLYDRALALANPLTREWAHDKFVEKEKKYYWKLKDNRDFCLVNVDVLINISFRNKSKLTESEIREWGFNPEMFDREEV